MFILCRLTTLVLSVTLSLVCRCNYVTHGTDETAGLVTTLNQDVTCNEVEGLHERG